MLFPEIMLEGIFSIHWGAAGGLNSVTSENRVFLVLLAPED